MRNAFKAIAVVVGSAALFAVLFPMAGGSINQLLGSQSTVGSCSTVGGQSTVGGASNVCPVPPPTTSVLVPSPGAAVSGTKVTLDAAASASYGVGITKVQFVLTGGTLNKAVVGTATRTLYGYIDEWNSTSVPSGIYTLQSLATDGAGNTAYSAGISVTVGS